MAIFLIIELAVLQTDKIMYMKVTKKMLFIFLLFSYIQIVAQNLHEVNLSITDTVIVIKKDKKSFRCPIKVHAEINAPNLQDTLFLYLFNKSVPPLPFFSDLSSDRYKTNSIGLAFVVESTDNHIITPEFEFVSYAKEKDDIKNTNSRVFVSSKQKIEYRQLDEKEKHNYDMAKYEISSEKQNLELYLIFHYTLGTSNTYYNLPKGEYYLYLLYSYNSDLLLNNSITNDLRIFKGYFFSNKVKLIVK